MAHSGGGLEGRLRRLEDAEQIRQLNLEYRRHLDTRDLDAYGRLFAEDGEWLGGTGYGQGPAGITAMLKERLADNPGPPGPTSWHLVTESAVDVRGDWATGTVTWALIQRGDGDKPVMRLLGHYDDVYVRERGRWRYRRRIAHTDIPHRKLDVPPGGYGGTGSPPMTGEVAPPGDSTEARLRRLEDLEQIRQLFVEYKTVLDKQDFAAYRALFATRRMPFATGVLNIWMHDPAEVASRRASLVARFGPRLLLGLGSSHAPLVESTLRVPYARPYSKMVEYLDALDGAETPVPAQMRMLAALGPRMLSLARTRAAAAHPYLVPPEHTAAARQALGPGITLAPEQAVVFGADPRLGRETARAFVHDYLALPNYVRNLRRLGFTDDDLQGRASDRLVDALVAYGDEDAIAARVRAHHDAGADHVCIYVIGGAHEELQLAAWRRLAPALTSL